VVGWPGLAARATPGDRAPFEEALDRFVPILPATTARYFPFTDLGPRPGDALSAPSEVERYAVLAPPPAGPPARLGQWSPPAPAVSVSPHPLLRLSSGGAFSRAWSAPGSAFASTGWQATVAPPAGPLSGRLAVSLAEELRGATSAPASSRIGAQSTASLQLRLAEPVLLRLEGHRSSERSHPGDGVEVDGARASVAVALRGPRLELTASGGVDRVQADADAVATGRSSLSLGLVSHLTPALTLSGSVSVQDGALTSAAAAGSLFGQLPASRLATAAVSWRASDRLQLSAALSRVDTRLGPEAARQLRATWLPAARGPLRISAAYDESVDPATGTRGAQAVLQPSLRLGRFASIEASLSEAIQRVAGPVAHPLAVVVSFTIRS
jgi:hypothetical protein